MPEARSQSKPCSISNSQRDETRRKASKTCVTVTVASPCFVVVVSVLDRIVDVHRDDDHKIGDATVTGDIRRTACRVCSSLAVTD